MELGRNMSTLKRDTTTALGAGATSLAFAVLGGFVQTAHAADAEAAKEVVVTGQKAVISPKQTAPLRDTPKAITVIPQEIIQQTGATSLVEALRTVPGITFGAGEGGNPVGDRPFLRGYDAQSATFVDGLRDIGSQSREVFNTESIEVIKGASGSYAGRGGAGGGVYINNKTPQRQDFTTASFGLGSAEYKRATVDINHVFGDTGMAGRLNLMVHDAGVAGRDEVHASRWGIAPSVAFGLGSPTRATVSFYHLQSDDLPDAGIPYNNPTAPTAAVMGLPRTLQAGNGEPLDVDRSTYYGMVDRDFRKERVDTATIRVEHNLSRDLHLRNTTRYSNSAQDYIWTQPDDSKGNIYYGYVWRRPNSRVSDVSTLINQTDFYGTFKTGTIAHNFSTGLEFSREEGENDSYNVYYNGLLASTYSPCTTASLAYYVCTTVNNPNANDPFTGTIVRANNPTNAQTETRALYAFDTIEFNDQWQANLGVRFDSYHATFITARANTPTVPATHNLRTTYKRDDDLFNYQASLIYKPVEKAAVYISYATSSTPAGNALAQGSDSNALSSTGNANLDPEKNATLEAGAKWDVFDGKLSLTSAIFEVKTTNARVAIDATNFAMVGEKRVRGFEIGASGSITDKWDVFGGYTYLDAILVKNGLTASALLSEGQPFPNTPKDSASLWTTYKVTPKLKLGGGVNYMAKVMGSTTSVVTAQKFIPAYTRLDATASYTINDKLDLQLNVQNLTDKVYFTQAYPTHYASIAAGRSVVLTLNAKF
jgi:catecholate siderophore receptor